MTPISDRIQHPLVVAADEGKGDGGGVGGGDGGVGCQKRQEFSTTLKVRSWVKTSSFEV
jgi:hypothetical protein